MLKKILMIVTVVWCSIFMCYADSNHVYCKYCGNSFISIETMASSYCYKSSNGKHHLFEGPDADIYYCQWCGRSFRTLYEMANSAYCTKNPNTKKHEAYEGSIKHSYECKYCGRTFTSLEVMANSDCYKSPLEKRRHVPTR